jgi:sulfur transfer protein SufE
VNVECDFQAERDGAILRGIATLKRINQQPADEVLKND